MSSTRSAARLTLATMLVCMCPLVAPQAADAHRLTKAKATKKVRSVARQLSRELDGVEQWEAGACVRRSRHAFRCTYFLRFTDGDICGQRLRISYPSHSATRLSVRPASGFDCNL